MMLMTGWRERWRRRSGCAAEGARGPKAVGEEAHVEWSGRGSGEPEG